MYNHSTNRASERVRWLAAMAVPACLLFVGCPRTTGTHAADDAGPDAEAIDAAPPPTTHVVLLHTADTIGYVEPCG